MLDALRAGGDVEAAHLTDAERFRVLFAQIRSEVDGAAADLRHLAGLADHAAAASTGRQLDRLADRTLRHSAGSIAPVRCMDGADPDSGSR